MEKQYIGFRLNNKEFAVDILSVQEIIQNVPLTDVPQSDEAIAGIINLRGQVIPVMDLKSRFGMPETDDGSGTGNVMVVNAGGSLAGMQVDEITGVIPISSDHIEPVEKIYDNMPVTDVTGIARLKDQLILLPDLARILGKESTTGSSAPSEIVEQKPELITEGINEIEKKLISKADEGSQGSEDIQKLVAEIKNLMNALAGGDLAGAESAIDNLTKISEKKLFDEVGNITRNLHDSLKDFKRTLDPKIKSMATEDMPEAADNLEQVLNLTKQAADKTLNIVEKGLDDNENMRTVLDGFSASIEQLKKQAGSSQVIKSMETVGKELNEYITRSSEGYNEILMSQDFQDLTGQMIKRIIKLVHELETQLIELIKNFGVEVAQQKETPEDTEMAENKNELKGPASSTRIDQGDVDDLLSSFGF